MNEELTIHTYPWKTTEADSLLKNRNNLRSALKEIRDMKCEKVSEGFGPEDMSEDAKTFCMWVGRAVEIAKEALDA